MTDTIETTARQIVEKIQRDLFRSDIHPSEARKEHIAAIAAALEAERLEERERGAVIAEAFGKISEKLDPSSKNTVAACAFNIAAAIRSGETGEKPMFEDCTTCLTCSAIEAEMRDRLAAKDARIAELASAVAGKVQLIEPDPETIAWAEGVFAAEDAKNAAIEDLSRKLEASRHRVAELEQQPGGREMWAVWNSCNGVFEVTNWRHDALDIIAEAYSEHETAVPVRVFVEDEDRHGLRHAYEDEREAIRREGKHPNAESLAAMQELEDGGGETFSSVDDLMRLKTEKE